MLDEIAKLGTILGIWAHPDDETWCMGGLIAGARVNGQRVVCVTATKGGAGVQDVTKWPIDQLPAIRTRELEESLKILGGVEHQWLDYIDGRCKDVDINKAVAKLKKIIETVRPDTIVTFDAKGLTGHPDHKTVCGWTTRALASAQLPKKPRLLQTVDSRDWYEKSGRAFDKKFNIYFATDQPSLAFERDMAVCLRLDKKMLAVKLAALKAHHSQTEKLFAIGLDQELEDKFAVEGFLDNILQV